MKKRYPYLLACHVDEGFSRTMTVHSAELELCHYKGAMLLSVESKEERSCSGRPLAAPIWLRGDELDAAILMLREAKRVWLKAYRKAEREEQEAKRQRRRGRGGVSGG